MTLKIGLIEHVYKKYCKFVHCNKEIKHMSFEIRYVDAVFGISKRYLFKASCLRFNIKKKQVAIGYKNILLAHKFY